MAGDFQSLERMSRILFEDVFNFINHHLDGALTPVL